ncbi:LysR substrate-binding domain-containing protein [Reichenbachiella versicolor]|uniref:LysR substrate-binding domain-containing protein n=1 Tax=Reichenbachiella versicolor TaxID=1821036 RepID=UPI000D6DFE8B|nr:LysR substrate-binding domain-containing protein [Reichenbachiella versicolor]
MHYTLHQLKIFTYVVKYQSITKASEELFLTQPAVSIQLKKLQDQFDIPLTEVIGRQLFVTEFGREIAEVANRILDESSKINSMVDQFKGFLSGKITVSVVSTGKYVMPYFLNKFLKDHPKVEISMNVTNRSAVLESLTNNETDFALVSVPPEDLKVNQIELMENRLQLVCNSDLYKELPDRKLTKKDIEKLPLIFREQGSATRRAMEDYLNSHDIHPKPRLELMSNEAVKQAVNAGLGFSIMPLIGLRHELLSGEMKIVSAKDLPVVTEWTLIYLKGKKLSPAAHAFEDYVNQHKDDVIEKYFTWTEQDFH